MLLSTYILFLCQVNAMLQQIIITDNQCSPCTRGSYVQIRVNETRNILPNCCISTFQAHI